MIYGTHRSRPIIFNQSFPILSRKSIAIIIENKKTKASKIRYNETETNCA